MANEQGGLEMSWVKIVAGGLAAMSAAVAASFLGVYGTIIGAALMSAISTVGATVYESSMHRTGTRLRRARDGRRVPLRRPRLSLPRLRVPVRPGRLAAGAGAMFVLALAGITVVELAAQQPMATILSGTRTVGSETSIGAAVKKTDGAARETTPGHEGGPPGAPKGSSPSPTSSVSGSRPSPAASSSESAPAAPSAAPTPAPKEGGPASTPPASPTPSTGDRQGRVTNGLRSTQPDPGSAPTVP